MTALVTVVNPDEDSPETKEEHEEGVVTLEVVGVHLYPHEHRDQEEGLEVSKGCGKSFVPWDNLRGKLLCHHSSHYSSPIYKPLLSCQTARGSHRRPPQLWGTLTRPP